MTKKKQGKIFEEDFESSCKRLNIFFNRNRDVYIPPDLRPRIRLPKNKYDNFFFTQGHLFAIELKSTKNKSFSFDESIIKQHQIDNLLDASTYKDVIAGIVFNFRSVDNRTYFVEINDFVKYKFVAENEIKEHEYKSKINKSSIPFLICEEIGIKIKNDLLKTRYHYHIDQFVEKVISNRTNCVANSM